MKPWQPPAAFLDTGATSQAGRLPENGPAQRLVDRLIYEVQERTAPIQAKIFAHAVEHDNLVVHRVSDQRKWSGNDRQINLAASERKQAERDDDVMHRRNNRGRTGNQFEAEAT